MALERKKLEFITEMYKKHNNEALALLEQNNLAYCSKGEIGKLDKRWYCYKIWHQKANVLFEKTLQLITQMDQYRNNEALALLDQNNLAYCSNGEMTTYHCFKIYELDQSDLF